MARVQVQLLLILCWVVTHTHIHIINNRKTKMSQHILYYRRETFLVLCVVAKSIFMKTKNPLFLIDPMVNMRYTPKVMLMCVRFITNSQICRLGVRLF